MFSKNTKNTISVYSPGKKSPGGNTQDKNTQDKNKRDSNIEIGMWIQDNPEKTLVEVIKILKQYDVNTKDLISSSIKIK